MRRRIFHLVLRLGTCSQRQREACEKLERVAGSPGLVALAVLSQFASVALAG